MKVKVMLAALFCLLTIGLIPGPALAKNHPQAAPITAEWSRAAVTCHPDDGTTASEYKADTVGGKLSYKGAKTDSIYFWCNVDNPLDAGFAQDVLDSAHTAPDVEQRFPRNAGPLQRVQQHAGRFTGPLFAIVLQLAHGHFLIK